MIKVKLPVVNLTIGMILHYIILTIHTQHIITYSMKVSLHARHRQQRVEGLD